MPEASTAALRVLLHGQPIGHLRNVPAQKHATASAVPHPLAAPSQGWLQFSYSAEWLQRSDAVALSLHLPLQAKPFSHWACHAWFDGLLPHGAARQQLAAALHLAADDTLALLDALGGDCLGAVQFTAENPAARRWQLPPAAAAPQAAQASAKPRVAQLRKAKTATQQLALFDDAPPAPQAAQPDTPAAAHAAQNAADTGDALLQRFAQHPARTSAEARAIWPARQDMTLPVRHTADATPVIALPDTTRASSHVLWLAEAGQSLALWQRLLCQHLLQAMQIPVQPLRALPQATGLLQTRTDRNAAPNATARPIAAETLAQALGWAPGAAKPLREQGWPACFALLRQQARPRASAVLQLLDAIIALTLLGDASASPHQLLLLHACGDQGVRLAPLGVAEINPLTTTAVNPPLTLAVPIGGHTLCSPPPATAWNLLARQCLLSPNQVRKRVRLLAGHLQQALPTSPEALHADAEPALTAFRQALLDRSQHCAQAAT